MTLVSFLSLFRTWSTSILNRKQKKTEKDFQPSFCFCRTRLRGSALRNGMKTTTESDCRASRSLYRQWLAEGTARHPINRPPRTPKSYLSSMISQTYLPFHCVLVTLSSQPDTTKTIVYSAK